MKTQTTRRALIVSILSLLVCVSMLIGTTFAWFTDSVTSGRNTIQSGNLDVVLEYWDGDSYEEVSSTTKLFDDAARWEPGYTEVAYLKVSNAGSLALKYHLAVNVYNETLGKTKTGADIKLSDHLQFKVVESDTDLADTYTSREAAQNANATATKLQTYDSADKALEKKGDADYVALIVYMPTTVGNEANHDGANIPAIEMGVSLFATQQTAESDSFDNQYDKNAELPWDGKIPDITLDDLNPDVVFKTDTRYVDATKSSVTVSNAGELLWVMNQNSTAIDNYFANKYPGFITAGWGSWTIKLDDDIDFGALPIAPMELRAKVFDGQGYTIKNVIVDGNGGQAGLFKWNGGTIQNLTVENITVVNGGGYGTGAVAGGGGNYVNVTAKNIKVSGEYAVGGISGYYGYTYTNCSVIGEANTITSTTSDCPDGVGGIAGFLNTDTTETILFTNCKVENTTISATDEVGGIVGRAVALGTNDSITLEGCTTSGVTLNTTDASATYKGDLIGRNYNDGNVFINN